MEGVAATTTPPGVGQATTIHMVKMAPDMEAAAATASAPVRIS